MIDEKRDFYLDFINPPPRKCNVEVAKERCNRSIQVVK